ncbi:hypothetical protein DFS33DRAFT_1457369 [Desarmillaria ectypa]|nr:hypothetical protein DFS33DRAFT_1457369 [Desarmillaria ectypa]
MTSLGGSNNQGEVPDLGNKNTCRLEEKLEELSMETFNIHRRGSTLVPTAKHLAQKLLRSSTYKINFREKLNIYGPCAASLYWGKQLRIPYERHFSATGRDDEIRIDPNQWRNRKHELKLDCCMSGGSSRLQKTCNYHFSWREDLCIISWFRKLICVNFRRWTTYNDQKLEFHPAWDLGHLQVALCREPCYYVKFLTEPSEQKVGFERKRAALGQNNLLVVNLSKNTTTLGGMKN